jgi:hypothetical protein
MKTSWIRIGWVVLGAMWLAGCSVYMAVTQPGQKRVDLFKAGTARDQLLVEFGLPAESEIRADGRKYELFSFVQGYSTSAKTGRAILHTAADVMTFGLWEVVGTPTEMIFDGTEEAFEVRYDESDIVDQVKVLKRACTAPEDDPPPESAPGTGN